MLKRQLGFWDSVAINIGIVIGVGIFRVPADVAVYLNNPTMILIAWVLGGLISLLGVLCYAELSSCFPETGGTYVYLREAYGKLVGFLFGWMELTVFRAGSLAGVAYVFAAYLKHFFDFGPGTEKVIAVMGIVTFTSLNILGLRYGTRVQNVLSSIKVLTLLGLVFVIFTASGEGALTRQAAQSVDWNWLALAPALIPILWSYGGWHESTFMSGEFKDTRWALPLSLVVSILVIMSLYLATNLAYMRFLSPAEMVGMESIAADILHKISGPTGKLIMAGMILLSACGALNSYIMTGARIPYAIAGDTKRLEWLGAIHPKLGTPMRSYLLNGVWATLLALWGSFGDLVFFTAFAKWIFFTLAGISVFILRKKTKSKEGFLMVGYPVVPALFTGVSLLLLATTLYHAQKASLLGALLLLLGIPLFFFLKREERARS